MAANPPRGPMLVGFAVTEHCNLRCPHCIRDDVTTVRSLEAELIERVVDEALVFYGAIVVSLTGGEPLLHPEFARIIQGFAARGVPYRFVTNGWHWKRIARFAERYPPQAVRLSLSGGTEATHDAERGRGSFRRVLLSAAVLTSRRIPFYLSLVVDRRDRHELRAAADLAEALGAVGLSYILPQPTPGSAVRDSDLAPGEWWEVRREVDALALEPERETLAGMDYGYPFDGAEHLCHTFALRRIYVDTRGRVCTCCQLSNYGFNEAEVMADLHEVSLAEAHRLYVAWLKELYAAQRPNPAVPHMTDPFPCLRCARTSGKLGWLQEFPQSGWHEAADAEPASAAISRGDAWER